nr:AGE family epimerase/isomerase [uncultured Gellertiella sp.]
MPSAPTIERADTLPWTARPAHRRWLENEAERLFTLFGPHTIHPRGGFRELDPHGALRLEDDPARGVHMSARMVHCAVIGALRGRPGLDGMIDHGMWSIWNRHRDHDRGGYVWAINNEGAQDSTRQGYGHAFVLLAASSASLIGHPLAGNMLADVTEVLVSRFWEERHGAIAEEFTADWGPMGPYRGQNSNMHLTEALMAAFEATGERDYLDKAERIAELIIRCHAAACGYRLPEHFTEDWQVDEAYSGHEMFRPSGTTPGHSLEWARLLLQLWALSGKNRDWMAEAARALFFQAMSLGWDKEHGGFHYTLDWENRPSRPVKLWWPLAEGAGASAVLNRHFPGEFHEQSYRKIWNRIAASFIDTVNGGWHEERSADLKPSNHLFHGKADIYHALQACLIPLYPAEGSLTRMIIAENDALAAAAGEPAP